MIQGGAREVISRLSGLTVHPARRVAQGMGRPAKAPNKKKVTVSVAMSPDVLEALRKAAEADHRSLSSMIESIVSNYVKSNKIVNKKLTP